MQNRRIRELNLVEPTDKGFLVDDPASRAVRLQKIHIRVPYRAMGLGIEAGLELLEYLTAAGPVGNPQQKKIMPSLVLPEVLLQYRFPLCRADWGNNARLLLRRGFPVQVNGNGATKIDWDIVTPWKTGVEFH